MNHVAGPDRSAPDGLHPAGSPILRDDAGFDWQLPARFNFGRDVVDAWAQRAPTKLALLCCTDTPDAREARRYTFADVSRLSSQAAHLLASQGVRQGDRVIVMLPRIAQWHIAMVACAKLGAVPIPCIDMLTAKDVLFRIGQAGVTAVITTAANTAKFTEAPASVAVRLQVGGTARPGWLDFDAAAAAQPGHFEAADLDLEAPAVLYFTSGSTGLPKGVTHAVRGLYCWRVSAIHWQGLTHQDLMWCTADTGWSKAGTSLLFGPWSCGTAVLFYDGRFDARRRLELIREHRVTVFCGAATEFRHLVALGLQDWPMPDLRLAVSAGESVNPEVVRRWQADTGVPLLESYGQTETLMTVGNRAGLALRPGSMGKPLPGTQVAALDEQGRPCAAAERGQLAIRLPNPQLMLGYWQDPQRTAASRIRHDGVDWFLTGDLATIDADGYVWYQGRADDIIGSAGYRIGPMEVENALIEHPAVLETAVVGAPDPERGEIVKAFVVLRPGYTGDDALVAALQAHVREVTAPYKYPRAIEFVDALPKTVSGKLLRRELRDREYRRSAGS